jgi:hypothetical protein
MTSNDTSPNVEKNKIITNFQVHPPPCKKRLFKWVTQCKKSPLKLKKVGSSHVNVVHFAIDVQGICLSKANGHVSRHHLSMCQ